jgi:hypothetical protein
LKSRVVFGGSVDGERIALLDVFGEYFALFILVLRGHVREVSEQQRLWR